MARNSSVMSELLVFIVSSNLWRILRYLRLQERLTAGALCASGGAEASWAGASWDDGCGVSETMVAGSQTA